MSTANDNMLQYAEELMRLAELAEGIKGYGVSPAFYGKLHEIIESERHQAVLEARIDELEKLTLDNFDLQADHQQWSKSVLSYIKERLAQLRAEQEKKL